MMTSDPQLTWDEREAVRPYEQAQMTLTHFGDLTDEQLLSLIAACEKCKTTNIWYVTYGAAQTMLPNLRREIEERGKCARAKAEQEK